MTLGDVSSGCVSIGSEEMQVLVVLLTLGVSVLGMGLGDEVLIAVGAKGSGFEVGEGSVVAGLSQLPIGVRVLILHLIRHLLNVVCILLRLIRLPHCLLRRRPSTIKFLFLLLQLGLLRLELCHCIALVQDSFSVFL
jgi:hypothetical protein